MKRNLIAVAILLFMLPAVAGAQALKGSYFLDNSINRHKMNPAFAPRANYLQLPVVSNIGVGLYSNIDIPLLTYPVNGGLGTFLHPSVSLDQFQKELPKHPHIDMEVNTNILSFGWFNKNKAFWNFTLDARMMADSDVPSDLFLLLKKGIGAEAAQFNVGNMNAYATATVQAALGYSKEFVKGLRAGFKIRAIAPVAYAGLNLEQVKLVTGADKWSFVTEGYAYTAVQGLRLNLPEGEQTHTMDFDLNGMIRNKVLAGFGYSVDLGIEYKLEVGSILDGMAFSAAVTDLGQIFYKKNCLSAFNTSGQVDWTGFHIDENLQVNAEEAIDDLMSNLESLASMQEMEHPHKFERSTMPRFYAGFELPFLKRSMSIGLLYSGRLSHSYARHELTASYNLKPCKWFALGVNYSFLNTTRSMGAMLELTPKAGPSIYFGLDYFPMEWTHAPLLEDYFGEAPAVLSKFGFETWPLPTSTNINFNFGLAFNLGSKYVNPKKAKKNKN